MKDEIIGIFDIENTTVSKHTKSFLNFYQKEKEVVNLTFDLPKAFIVSKNTVFISQLNSKTLKNRIF